MILINGNFLCRNLTGIERFAWEVCAKLDSLIDSNIKVAMLVPFNAKKIPEYKNIILIKSKKAIKSFPLWDLFYFSSECKKHHAIGLNFSNTAPLGKNCGFAFIHDIYAKDFPGDFKSKKDFLIKLYCRLNYKNICKNAKKIITVSNFSKNQIIKAYKVKENRIAVLPNGWEHFNQIEDDESIFEKFPVLKEKEFFFTLGSLQKRKNLKWIAEYAQNHPEDFFAISGKIIGGMHSDAISNLRKMNNVLLLGYVSDSQVKALMKKCLAFVFPSYYEGFGIPPLEALSVGAKIIVAKAASLPEIYGSAAQYIDPYNADCNLKEMLKNKTESAESVLKLYTYQNAAENLYKIIMEQR